jgi:hypothetical protein
MYHTSTLLVSGIVAYLTSEFGRFDIVSMGMLGHCQGV